LATGSIPVAGNFWGVGLPWRNRSLKKRNLNFMD
jgi:hypothetical protein